MIKCKYCGTQLPEGTDFCTTCGAMAKKPDFTEPIKETTASTEAQKFPDTKASVHGGYLAWSVINIILSTPFFFLGTPIVSLVLSIIALVKTIKAKLHTAKILNITATAITIISIILFIAAIFVLVLAGGRIFDIPSHYYYEFMD